MASESGTSHKAISSNLPDEGVLENLIETDDGVDDTGEYNDQRILEDPASGYVSVSLFY